MAEGAAPAGPASGSQKNGAAAAAAGPYKQRRERRGIISRLWKGLFGPGDDLEKFLQHLSKEEAAVQARLKNRAISLQKTVRNVIAVSLILEVVAVAYAITKTRESDLNWQLRAIHVLPMFLLPGFSALIYSALISFTRILDRKDNKTLERLRAERQAKIDELKERTNYYTTQQLIQKYDDDPAAKAAAATVLANKLGIDSGLKVYVGGDSGIDTSGRSSNVELVQSSGLRNRKPSHVRGNTPGNFSLSQLINENPNAYPAHALEHNSPSQELVGNYNSSTPNTGGWFARVAALLVGEDPTQCYALICSNCYMHNGLVRKEDFSYVTYYCPYCHALNGSTHPEERQDALEKDIPTSSLDGTSSVADESNRSSLAGNAAGSSLPPVQEQISEK